MKINYYNGEGNDDLLNIEGGIADALNKIAYEDDRQVWHSSIDQYLVFKDPTWYKIELQFLEPGIIPRDGELEKQGKK